MALVKAYKERLCVEVDEYVGPEYLRYYRKKREGGELELLTSNLDKKSITFMSTDTGELAKHPELLEKENKRWIKITFKDTWRVIFVVSNCSDAVTIYSLHSLNSKPKELGTLTWQGSHIVMYVWEMYLKNNGEE